MTASDGLARSKRPNVFSIEPDAPFADTLVDHIISQVGDDPEALASALLFIPTQRGRGPIETAFLNRLDGKPSLLPTIYPLGDVSDLVEGLALSLVGPHAPIKPVISEGKRRVLLMGMIERWARLSGMGRRASDSEDFAAIAPAQAWRLAAQLGSFLDELTRFKVESKALENVVESDHATHWQRIIGFLKIITESWPNILEARGEIDAVMAEDMALAALADHLAENAITSPIFVAGSTGTRPMVRRLLGVIARLDQGHVLLPGLDRDMEDAVWDTLPSHHPQWPLRQLLDDMQVNRFEVELLSARDHARPDRLAFLREAMIPAPLTKRWARSDLQRSARLADRSLDGFSLAVARNRREEASIIAIAMREVIEQGETLDPTSGARKPAPTVALITPDRTLAEEVKATLQTWSIDCDDSAGTAARLTLPGRFLQLVAQAAGDDFAPVSLLALLQHPLMAAGIDRSKLRSLTRKLDKYVLRGPRPKPGLDGVRAAMLRAQKDWRSFNKQRDDSQNPIGTNDVALWDQLADRLQGFADIMQGEQQAPTAIMRAHIEASEALAATEDKPGDQVIWIRDAGTALARHLRTAIDDLSDAQPIAPQAYAALFEAILDDLTVRPSWRGHPRAFILGQIEARMQSADLMILSGLNAGTWPADLPVDPWLNASMRNELGLPPADSRTALALHDFTMAASGKRVLLTRAEKIDGSPTVPSRILYRMQALLGGDLPRASRLEALARAFDHPEPDSKTIAPPAPKPPRDARPKELAVTDIERWMRDPYALYAKKILGLRPLNPVDQVPSAADKGTILHEALENWVRDTHDRPALRTTPVGRDMLIAAGEKAFETVIDQPAVRAFWWPRFLTLADWVIKDGKNRWAGQDTVGIEIKGKWRVPDTDFTVTATADRIDRSLDDGRYIVIDYKTGGVPSDKAIAAGFRPQLPLEGVILEAGGFPGLAAGEIGGLEFWPLKGDAKAPDIKGVKNPNDRMEDAAEGIYRLVVAFDDEAIPYLSHPRAVAEATHQGAGDYDHLARVDEWRGSAAPDGREQPKRDAS